MYCIPFSIFFRTICELLANSNEDRKRFVTGLYSSLKKILTLLQVKLSNMSPGLVSGDEVFFFESLPALSFSLLKFFRLLVAESASSCTSIRVSEVFDQLKKLFYNEICSPFLFLIVSISVLLACERLLMLFSFVTSTTLKFFSCQSTDANFAEGLGKTKASESEFLLLKPLVSISENSRDLFRSILPRVANSLIRLVEHLLDDSLTGLKFMLRRALSLSQNLYIQTIVLNKQKEMRFITITTVYTSTTLIYSRKCTDYCHVNH